MTSAPIDTPCPKCTPGVAPHDPARCIGHVDEDDGTIRPCKKRPRKGGTVCGSHGGKAPQVEAANARRLAQQQATGEIGRLVESLQLDPATISYAEVMADQVTWAHGMATVLKLEVDKLDLADLYGPDHLGDARPHILVTMMRDWVTEAARLSKMAMDAGVDERQVRLMEGRGAQIAAVLGAFVEWVLARVVELGFDPGAAAALRSDEVPKGLRQAITTTLAGEEMAS